MSKIFKNFKMDQKYINLSFKKKLLYYDKELNKFNLREIFVKDYLKDGKNLLLFPYPCKNYF